MDRVVGRNGEGGGGGGGGWGVREREYETGRKRWGQNRLSEF